MPDNYNNPTSAASALPPPPQRPSLAPPRRKRRWPVIAGALLVLGGLAFGLWHATAGGSAPQSRRNQSVPVALATIGTGDIDITDPALGTVTPLAGVTVRTQINGTLQEVAFTEGEIVRKGDFLAEVDPRPYQNTLEQAQGALLRDAALLKEAQINLVRYQTLLKQDSIAKQQVDTQESLVKQYEGAVVADEGQINQAKLDIGYCHIVAPITGRIGLRQVDAGNYVQTGDANGIVTITQLDPISVLFALPEDDLPAIMKRLQDGATLQATAYDRTQSTVLAVGKLTAVDNSIDTSTGTVKLRALFDNPKNALFPDQFVNIKLLVDTDRNVVIAPQSAVLRGSNGPFVYVAQPDHTVKMTPVTLGPSEGDNIEIVKGLAAGDKVVTEGTDKLRDGQRYTLPGENPPPAGRKNGKKNVAPQQPAPAATPQQSAPAQPASGGGDAT